MNFNTLHKISLLIFIIIISSSLNIIFAQQSSIFSFSIKDTDGEANGKYYDIQIDSIFFNSDTTIDFQMIPDIEIQDSTLKNKYSSFLEMIMRSTNTDISVNDDSSLVRPHSQEFYRWDLPIDYQVIYPYSDLNWVQKIDSVAEAINLSYGDQMFIKHTNPYGNNPKLTEGWNFDYRFGPDHLLFALPKITKQSFNEFYSDGRPKVLAFDIISEIEPTKDINFRIALGFLKALLIANNLNDSFVDQDGNFNQDAINLINVLYNLEQGYDFSLIQSDLNRTPISFPQFSSEGYALTDVPLTSLSIDPDGEIINHRWYAYNGDPEDNTFSITNPNSPNASFYSVYPGMYTIGLEVEDDKGKKDIFEKKIEIYHDNESPIEMKAVSLGVYWERNMLDWIVREHFKALKRDGVEYISFQPLWWFSDTSSNEIIPIYYYDGEQDPRGKTIPDEKLENYIQIAIEESLNIMIKPHIKIFENMPQDPGRWAISPRPEFFNSENGYNHFILHYADIAEKYRNLENEPGVKLFCLGTELSNLQKSYGHYLWRELADSVRNHYSGELTYDQHYHTFENSEWAKARVFPFDCVDIIGVSAYFSIANNNNASIIYMTDSLRKIIDMQLRPIQQKYNKPLIFAECGYPNVDGGTVSELGDWHLIPKSKRDDEEQRRAYNALFRNITNLYRNDETWFKGVYCWSWLVNNDAAEQIVRNNYLGLRWRSYPAQLTIKTNYK